MSPSRDDAASATDPEVVERAMLGDPDAFTLLFEHYKVGVYGYVAGLVSNSEDAHDLLQKTFLNAWEKLPTLHDVSKFKPWLYTIARNLAHDYRRQKRREALQPLEDAEYERDTNEPIPEENIAVGELVNMTLAKLPLKHRDCLLLRIKGGFSASEIARVLGISQESVYTYLSNARKQFKQIYQQLERVQNATRKGGSTL